MKDQFKKSIGLILLGIAIMLSSVIYAYSQRYEIIKSNSGIILKVDKWTGKANYIIKPD